ncbi:MAG TPA: glycosyltransferase family 9 protein [Chthoniobacteraceae bacterium]|nr:glycosyltransferase family 9 protein [Chthoniobacteraceae bacterium]
MATSNAPREILIVKPSSLGDVVHTLPATVELRRAFPESKIRWLVNTEWKPLLEGLAHIDEAIEFPRREFRGARGLLRIGSWTSDLRKRINADLVLDYQGLLRSAVIAKLCRKPDGHVIGLADAREGARFFYHQAASTTGCLHAVDRYLALTRFVTGLPTNELEWPLPQGRAPQKFAASEKPSFPYVLLHPFARGEGKSLSSEQVARFCESMAPHRVVIAGRSDQLAPRFDNVSDMLNGTDLHELIWLLRHASYVVSVDSGPMHIAAAVTSRLTSIHTWSDPAKVGPYRPEAWVWRGGKLYQQRDREIPATHREATNISYLAEFVKSQL